MLRSLILSAVDWDVLCPWLLLRKSLKNAFTFRLLFVTTLHLLVVSLWLAAAFGWFSASRKVSDFLQTYSPISAYVPHTTEVLADANLALETELLKTEQATPGTDPLAGMNSTTPSPLELLVQETEAETE
ncbi:MAG: hypothetical protein K6C40_09820, partial [Thermoguttaceae bacterium]|nr:hypothetical protein [Thermoguttaceae bacterium]